MPADLQVEASWIKVPRNGEQRLNDEQERDGQRRASSIKLQ
jgi:hypothetical protein